MAESFEAGPRERRVLREGGQGAISASRTVPSFDATRVRLTMPGVVSCSSLRPFGRPRCSAQVIVDCLREGGLKRRWTKQEDEKLCLAVKAVGTHDWKRIAEQHLAGHGRSDVQCLHRWQKVLRAGLVKGAFTEEEDKIIIACMNEGGLTWMQIAERIPGRIGKQCRERWTNHLDPNLKKGG